MKKTDIIALVLVLIAFRTQVMDYGKIAIDKVKNIANQVAVVVEIEKPSNEDLERVKDTKIDDFDYTVKDSIILGVFFDNFSNNVTEIDEGAVNEVVFEHFADSIYAYLVANKLDGNYSGFKDEVKTLFAQDLSEDGTYGTVDVEDLKKLSKTSRAIAWVVVNE